MTPRRRPRPAVDAPGGRAEKRRRSRDIRRAPASPRSRRAPRTRGTARAALAPRRRGSGRQLGSVARVRPPRARGSAGDVVASHRQSCRKFPRTVPSEGHVTRAVDTSARSAPALSARTRAPRGPRRPDAMATFTSASRLHAAASPPREGTRRAPARSPSAPVPPPVGTKAP